MRITHILGLILSMIVTACVNAQTPATRASPSFEAGSYSPREYDETMALRNKIRTQAATQPSHLFAGQYYQGDGLGSNESLDLSPGNEFTFANHGCMGLYDLAHGTVTLNSHILEFHAAASENKEDSRRIPAKLIVVPWGKRTYLIDPNSIDSFVERANCSWEPRYDSHGIGFLKEGDEKITVTGDPDLPAEYRAKLAPIVSAKVIAISEPIVRNPKFPDDRVRMITLDIGSAGGVKDLMMLSTGPISWRSSIYIKKAQANQCVGEMSESGGQVAVKVGDNVTGRLFVLWYLKSLKTDD